MPVKQQHCTSLSDSIKPLTMARHSQQPQNHLARQHGEQLNRQPVHTDTGRQRAEMEGSRQREERMREKAMNGPNRIGLLDSFPLKKNRGMREDRERETGAEEGGNALPSLGAVGGASLCCCRSHQSQDPCTGSKGQGRET